MLFPLTRAWTTLQKCMIASLVMFTCAAGALFIYNYERTHQQRPGLDYVENLGFGFKRITNQRLYDGWGHSEYFAYRGRILCQLSPSVSPSISPSGRFAIYQDVLSGKLFLFRRADEKITELTPKFVGLPYPIVWHEDQGSVEAQFEKEQTSMIFPLQ